MGLRVKPAMTGAWSYKLDGGLMQLRFFVEDDDILNVTPVNDSAKTLILPLDEPIRVAIDGIAGVWLEESRYDALLEALQMSK